MPRVVFRSLHPSVRCWRETGSRASIALLLPIATRSTRAAMICLTRSTNGPKPSRNCLRITMRWPWRCSAPVKILASTGMAASPFPT
ncbi:UNVERIFIED_CONTAM: hypothetical protein GTU68_010233 [Idotea baltica]|nr:hypothetical protein [Idotea baltica]